MQVIYQTHDPKPRKHHVDAVVHCFYKQRHLPRRTVSTTHYLTDMRDGIDCGEERTIQPSPTLRYKLWERFGNISLADGPFDVFEHPEEQMDGLDLEGSKKRTVPARISFGYQLETKNTLQILNLEFHKNRKSLTSSARSTACQRTSG
jgi:hypothetical protein